MRERERASGNVFQITLAVDPDSYVFDRWYLIRVDSAIANDQFHFELGYRWLHGCNTAMMALTMRTAQPFGLFSIYRIDTVTTLFAGVADDFDAGNGSHAFGCDRAPDPFYYRHWLNEI